LSFVCFGIAFIGCIFFWRRWRLLIDPKVGKKYDNEQLIHKDGFDNAGLAELYRHPLEILFPSPSGN
jgi:hypothetical protein